MDIISYNVGATANDRIGKVNANPDSNSGIVTVPSVIATGDSVTIPAGRTAVLPNLQVDGELVIDGEVFVPSGATFGDLDTTKEDKDIVNTDNVPNIYIGGKRKEWTKGIPSHTGIIAIELSGLYGQSSMNGMMNVNLLEVGSTKVARTLVVSGQWNNGTSMWDYGFANDLTGTDTLAIRFARDVANSKVYVLLGETTTVWANTRVSIEVPMSSYNSGLNLGFIIGTMSSLTGITVDYTKNIDTKAPIASPALTGTPTAPTPTAGDNSTKIATTTFVKAKSELDSIGVGQTWLNVGGDRAVGVTYTNTTGKPIMVICGLQFAPPVMAYLFVDGKGISWTQSGGERANVSAIIPNGSSYYVDSYFGSFISYLWFELR